ncbi:MAG: hypothetical protein RL000_1702 [Bacteroidota bacterium]|jgi:hypothetical protein
MLKKSLLLTFLSVLSYCLIQAQVPSLLNYQAVARNSAGTPLTNQAMQVRLSILHGSASGSSVYSEVRAVTTNAVGLFVIQIGSGGALSTSGNLATVNWTNGSKFLKVEIDPLGGSSYIELGTNQLVSVPYALSAAPSGAAGGDLTGNYPNPTLANNSVTTQKIADLSVTSVKLSDSLSRRINSSVPYTGANAAVDLGAFDLTVNGITVGMGAGSIATNTVIGDKTLYNNSTGYQNTANGHGALYSNTTGTGNTANGVYALKNNITGNYNSAIGYQADVGLSDLTNATSIGYGAIVNTSNTIQLGNSSIDSVVTAGKLKSGAITYPNTDSTAGYVLTTDGLGHATWQSVRTIPGLGSIIVPKGSDIRLKKEIKPLEKSLSQLLLLNPVNYLMKTSLASTDYNIKENGFIAQELQKIFPDLVIEGEDKDKLLSINYIALIPVLTKAIQEQQSQIEEQQRQIDELKKMMQALLDKK